MKHPRKLTLKEKKLLVSKGHDPKNYVRIKRTIDGIEFFNVETKQFLPVGW